VIRTWSHTTRNSFGIPAAKQMRYGGSLNILKRMNFEESDYQPKHRELNLPNRKT